MRRTQLARSAQRRYLTPAAAPPVRGARLWLQVLGRALASAWRDRVLGMAAEVGFWSLLSLAPLLLALLGLVGYITPVFGADAPNRIRHALLHASGHLLAPQAVDQILRPAINDVVFAGHATVISVGFALALWAGSTAMADYVNTITIAYDMRDVRGPVRTRLLAFGLYIGALVVGVIALPLLVIGPGWLTHAIPTDTRSVIDPVIGYAYWPLVLLLCIGAVTALFHLAVPARTRWRRNLPGATVAVGIWLAGSWLLRLYLALAFRHSKTYAGAGALVAALLFLYITALAILLGAELNSEIDHTFPNPTTTWAHRIAAGKRRHELDQRTPDAHTGADANPDRPDPGA